MFKMHSISLLSTPWSFWTGILSQVSKNDDEKTLLLRIIWFYKKVLTFGGVVKISEKSGDINTLWTAPKHDLAHCLNKLFCAQFANCRRFNEKHVCHLDSEKPFDVVIKDAYVDFHSTPFDLYFKY